MEGGVEKIDYIILGAGPGGLQLALTLQQHGLNYLMLEQGTSVGEFYKTYPRHRTLISINRMYTGETDPDVELRYDWNSLIGDFPRFNTLTDDYFPKADLLVKYLGSIQDKMKANVRYQTQIKNVMQDAETKEYKLTDQNGKMFQCKYLIIASGWNKERVPDYVKNCPGVMTYGNHTMDKERYKNKNVLIIGKGNSSFETADYILNVTKTIHIVASSPTRLSWFSRYVGHVRAVNNNFIDTYLLKSGNNILTMDIFDIQKKNDKYQVQLCMRQVMNKRNHFITYDEVICCAGFVFDDGILDDNLKPGLCSKSKFPLQRCNWESKASDNLYFAGTLQHILDVYSAASGFIHGFRYNSVVLGNYLAYKNHGIPLPSEELANATEVCKKIIERCNKASGIFLQQNFICDAFVPKENGKFQYYYSLTLPLATGDVFKDLDHYYIFTLALGHSRSNQVGSIDRFIETDRAYITENSHPVVRRFHKTDEVGEWHILDAIDSHWYPDQAFQLLPYVQYSMNIPELKLHKDTQEIMIDSRVEDVFETFTKKHALEIIPFTVDYMVADFTTEHDQGRVYCGKLKGDPSNIDWDVQIITVCPERKLFVLNVYPYKQMETAAKINHTLMFKMDGEAKTKIIWTTTFVSNLKEPLQKAILDKKAEFAKMFPGLALYRTYFSIKKDQKEMLTPCDQVMQLRKLFEASHPEVTQTDSPVFKFYFPTYMEGAKVAEKMNAAGVQTICAGFHGGSFVIVPNPVVLAEAQNLQALHDKIAACL